MHKSPDRRSDLPVTVNALGQPGSTESRERAQGNRKR